MSTLCSAENVAVAEDILLSFKWDSSVEDCKAPREIVKAKLS